MENKLLARIEEQRLYEIVESLPGERIVGISQGRAQAAEKLAKHRADSKVTCWYLDGFHADLATQHIEVLPNLEILWQADWPESDADLTLLPITKNGEAELTRELLQSAYHHLKVGGYLVASVDNPQDRWLHDQLKAYEKSVKVRPFDDAMVYFIQKSAPLKKLKDYSCELSFRDCDTTIRMVTRPSVFSHRQLDSGAKQLLDAVDVFPEAKLVDIGCGAGSVTLGLAARDPTAEIFAFDSNARAVQCTQRGAKLNDFDNVTVAANWRGDFGDDGSFDMALANPPYYADFRIAQQFVDSAFRMLRAGGRLVLVTKQPVWYAEHLPNLFGEVEVFESRRYHIASGVKLR